MHSECTLPRMQSLNLSSISLNSMLTTLLYIYATPPKSLPSSSANTSGCGHKAGFGTPYSLSEGFSGGGGKDGLGTCSWTASSSEDVEEEEESKVESDEEEELETLPSSSWRNLVGSCMWRCFVGRRVARKTNLFLEMQIEVTAGAGAGRDETCCFGVTTLFGLVRHSSSF